MRAEPFTDSQTGLREWRFTPAIAAPLWPLIRRVLMPLLFLLGFLCGAASVHAADPGCVQLRVRPELMTALVRQDLDIQTRVCRQADHRTLRVSWTSDVNTSGNSEQSLDGIHAPVFSQFWLVAQPSANYQFDAAVLDSRGHVLDADRARVRTATVTPMEND